RSYERLTFGGRRALLMNAPPKAESAACPIGATPDERRGLGYNAMARLAGPNLSAFIEIGGTLRAAGLSAPEIYAADPARGFALIEDLGDELYAHAIPAGADEETLYAAAIDALLALRAAAPKPPASDQYTMLSYDRTAMEAEIGLVPEWYWPFKKSAPPASSVVADYFAAWTRVLDALSTPAVLALRDYHAENLLWLPDRKGAGRVGLIDFQDGLVGQPAYDLVSLLEDARRDVSPALADKMIARYAKGAARFGDFDEDAFRRDYQILAAQRNAKILGIFARLVNRDSKPRYLEFLPRVEGHFRRDLARPALEPVRRFFAPHMPDLAA
ncbi:MAG TPA: phosphotransferase, partial [Parvularculaceae bacterium]|nr:phosphotransferase [Parvularculaceae bacterium]